MISLNQIQNFAEAFGLRCVVGMPADVPDGDDAAWEGAVSVQTDVSAGGLSIWFLQSQRRHSLHSAFDSLRFDLVNNSLIFFF